MSLSKFMAKNGIKPKAVAADIKDETEPKEGGLDEEASESAEEEAIEQHEDGPALDKFKKTRSAKVKFRGEDC